MTFTVATLHTPNIRDIGEFTAANKAAYCHRHGYRFVVETDRLGPAFARPASWSKILLVRRELEAADWVLWTDADAMIVNPAVRLESLADPDADFVIAKDRNGINAGVFLLRSCPAAFKFLDRVWSETSFIDHYWWEQAAIMYVLDTGAHGLRVKHPPKGAMNAYPEDYRPGDFIIHTPGREGRLDILRLYADEAAVGAGA